MDPGPTSTAFPLHCDSPVQAGSGVTTDASPLSVPDSASTTFRPSRTEIVADDLASRARLGCASSTCIDNRPWMVDSAPELGLTVPSPWTPSLVTPVAGL